MFLVWPLGNVNGIGLVLKTKPSGAPNCRRQAPSQLLEKNCRVLSGIGSGHHRLGSFPMEYTPLPREVAVLGSLLAV